MEAHPVLLNTTGTMKKEVASKKGITLIGLIITIAILIIAAALILPYLFTTEETNKKVDAKEEITAMYKASMGNGMSEFAYHGDMGCLPVNLSDLVVKGSQPAQEVYPIFTNEDEGGSGSNYQEDRVGIVGWRGPYFKPKRWNGTDILDPYGNPYQIVADSSSWKIVSMGKDGTLGTSDDIEGKSISVKKVTVDSQDYYYIPSSAKVSIAVGKHFSVKTVEYEIFYPFLPYASTSGFEQRTVTSLDPSELTSIPMGKRPVVAFVNMKLPGDSGCDFYNYRFYRKPGSTDEKDSFHAYEDTNAPKRLYSYQIVSFPIPPSQGEVHFQWPAAAEMIDGSDSHCDHFVLKTKIYARVTSSLEWDSSCDPSTDQGVRMKLWIYNRFGKKEESVDLKLDTDDGYFKTDPDPLKVTCIKKGPFTVITNSGQNTEICD